MIQAAHISAEAVLAVVFGWAAVAKIRRPAWWRGNLRSYRLPPILHRMAFAAVPWAELGTAVGVLSGLSQAADASALALLGSFSFAIVRARSSQTGNLLGCACFGGTRRHDFRILLLRNFVLGMCALAAWLTAGSATPSRPSTPLALVLATLGAAAVAWTLFVVRAGRRWTTPPGRSQPVRQS